MSSSSGTDETLSEKHAVLADRNMHYFCSREHCLVVLHPRAGGWSPVARLGPVFGRRSIVGDVPASGIAVVDPDACR